MKKEKKKTKSELKKEKEELEKESKNKEKKEKSKKKKENRKKVGKVIFTCFANIFFVAALVFSIYSIRNIYYINSIVKAENDLPKQTNYKIERHTSSSLIDLKMEVYVLNGKVKQHSTFDVNEEVFPDAEDQEFVGFVKDGKGYTVSLNNMNYQEIALTGTENLNDYYYSPFYHINFLDILKYKITKEEYDGVKCIKVENNLGEGVQCIYFREDTRLLFAEVIQDGSVNGQNVEFGVVTEKDVEEMDLEGYTKVEASSESEENQRILNIPIVFEKSEEKTLNKIYENDTYRVFTYGGELKCTLGEYTGKISEMLNVSFIIADDLVRQISTDCANGKCTMASYDDVQGLEFYYDTYTVFYFETKGKHNLYYFESGKTILDYANELLNAE